MTFLVHTLLLYDTQFHLEGERRMCVDDGEHKGVAEDVHHEVVGAVHGVGAAHILHARK